MDSREVLNQVEQRLLKVDARVDFHAVEAGVQQDDDWWYVPVITQMKSGCPVTREFHSVFSQG